MQPYSNLLEVESLFLFNLFWVTIINILFSNNICSLLILLKFIFGIFEPTCAYARWALMHHFLSVCLSVTRPKFKLDQKSLDQKSMAWQKRPKANDLTKSQWLDQKSLDQKWLAWPKATGTKFIDLGSNVYYTSLKLQNRFGSLMGLQEASLWLFLQVGSLQRQVAFLFNLLNKKFKSGCLLSLIDFSDIVNFSVRYLVKSMLCQKYKSIWALWI